MYDTTNTAAAIKTLAIEKGCSISALLKKCGLGKDAVNTMARRGSWLQADSLAKIADGLDCSVDYLLGRADNPAAHKSTVSVGDVSDNHGVIGNANAPLTINHTESNPQRSALLETYDKLTPVQQAKLLLFADNLLNGE